MIEIRIPIDIALAQRLEDLFCEEYQTFWMLHENWKTKEHQLRGYFESQENMSIELDRLRQQLPELGAPVETLELEDADWKEAYKLHFKPWTERGLHWVPVWERDNYPLPEGEQIVYLDPGMAFGTGNHETTRLCVRRLLDARDLWAGAQSSKSVIDAGCGSGILAISAAKLGFGQLFGFDNDPDSVRISIENAQLCEVAGQIDFQWLDLQQALRERTGDLLLVNILANVLCDHAELLCASVNPGGELILSGILAREIPEVYDAFAAVMLQQTGHKPPMDSRTDGDWADLRFFF
jgi:ribosomal protein L11 methyltransferase